MCSSIDSLSAILGQYKESFSIEHTLKDYRKYYAHTPPNFRTISVETLSEHLDLVQAYFQKLVDAHGLDPVIDKLILGYLSQLEVDSPVLANYIKKLFVHSICYHDHGKVNENFQASKHKMDNPYFRGKEDPENGIDTQHSTLSAFIFLCHKINEVLQIESFSSQEKNIAVSNCILFSYSIYRHHGKYFEDDFLDKIICDNQKGKKLQRYLSLFIGDAKFDKIVESLLKLETILPNISFSDYARSFQLYQLLRLNFSLLTASDYLATNEYMSGMPVDKFGTLERKRIDTIHNHVRESEWLDEGIKPNYNKKTYEELGTLSLDKPNNKSNVNLNLLRQQMATEAIRRVRNNTEQKIFYLEAPTGGGKTNISMLVAMELLKANAELNKVLYVFPFTTLIDQTYKSMIETLGLDENEIVALHSKASLQNETEDDQYGIAKKNYIDHLFINYPFCLLSHIRFFEILKTNEKEKNYLLHRLANSVVVIDELQAYSPDHWDKVMYLLVNYADFYNIRFVVMSATLPKLDRLRIERLPKKRVVYLLEDARKDYFQNANFKNRVEFDFSLLNKKIDLEELAKKILTESQKFSEMDGGWEKPVGSVFTIVEFIFKKSATWFHDLMNKTHNGFFDKIFVLSGTILTHRRLYIINYLKCKENRSKRILLITTQVVEAGVDIDMDLGFKDSSLIDSDEQLAGRINRNVDKSLCKLFLFNLDKESIIYGKDIRYEMMKKISSDEYEKILENKDFDYLYDKVIDFKNKRNIDPNFIGIGEYVSHFKELRFRSSSDKFKLIDQKNISCFIPMSVPIMVDAQKKGGKEMVFSKGDVQLLHEMGVFPDSENQIGGKAVFDLYIEVIHSKKSFFDRKIDLKRLQAIMSKFVFSLFATKDMEEKITLFADMEKSQYGYYYMERWEEFYNDASGIDESAFEDIDKVQFI